MTQPVPPQDKEPLRSLRKNLEKSSKDDPKFTPTFMDRGPAYNDEDLLDYFMTFVPEEFVDADLNTILNNPEAVEKTLQRIRFVSENANQYLEPVQRDMVQDLIWRSKGLGGYFNQQQEFFSAIDRLHACPIPMNHQIHGLTFFTRPRLCLQSSNLRADPAMVPLDTTNVNSTAFAIRALLDTNLHKVKIGSANENPYANLVNNCPLHDPHNPFLVPLVNAYESVSGFPDLALSVGSTDGGYYGEAQSIVDADDVMGARGNYTLNLTFRDVQGGPILSIFNYWVRYIHNVRYNVMRAYADDIDTLRMNFTISIYSFVMEPGTPYIRHYVKCTGCFPTAVPIGGVFNKQAGDFSIEAAKHISIPFTCNVVEYDIYPILYDFNRLVERYCPTINLDRQGNPASPNKANGKSAEIFHKRVPYFDRFANFTALPWITSDPNGFRMDWRQVEVPTLKSNATKQFINSLMDLDFGIRTRRSANDFAKEYYYPNQVKMEETFDSMYRKFFVNP